MKIIQLKAENLKRLKAVEISPDGNIVEITGRNGQGKSSVLDAIWWAVGGATHIQAVPIRKGENEARIRLDLGEIRVIRTFKKRDGAGGYTTQIVVENAEGARYPSPQKLLDALLGELSFDPLAFTRKDPKAQFEALKRFVPGVDFDAIDRLNRADFERRTEVNRQARALRNQVSGFDLPEEIPAERADVSALVEDLERVGEHNAALERRRARRQHTLSDAQARRVAAGEHRARAEEHRRIAQEADAEADRAEAAAAEAHRMLDEAPPLPEPLDASEVRRRIEAAQAANRTFDLAEQRAGLTAQAEQAEREASELTQAMAEREASKRTAIAAAAMPVDGLGFGDGEILLNGVPFEQASSAEQLRTSVAIAMAANPKLRVLRVQDGSLLDDEAMRILAEMAAAADYQIWIEVVQSGRSAAVVIEDGEVRGAVAAVAAE